MNEWPACLPEAGVSLSLSTTWTLVAGSLQRHPCGFDLPHRVLEDVLRLIGFQDKHRCQQVCRDWRELIRTGLALSLSQ